MSAVLYGAPQPSGIDHSRFWRETPCPGCNRLFPGEMPALCAECFLRAAVVSKRVPGECREEPASDRESAYEAARIDTQPTAPIGAAIVRAGVRVFALATRLGMRVEAVERGVLQWVSDVRHASKVRARRVGSEY